MEVGREAWEGGERGVEEEERYKVAGKGKKRTGGGEGRGKG